MHLFYIRNIQFNPFFLCAYKLYNCRRVFSENCVGLFIVDDPICKIICHHFIAALSMYRAYFNVLYHHHLRRYLHEIFPVGSGHVQ